MELILCFGLAISMFALFIVFVVGLISAPSPVLVVILIAGILLTQKSIDTKFNAPEINLADKEKNRVESVEVAIQNKNEDIIELKDVQQLNDKKQKTLKTMSYRGFNYPVSAKSEKMTVNKSKRTLQYRGRKTKTVENV